MLHSARIAGWLVLLLLIFSELVRPTSHYSFLEREIASHHFYQALSYLKTYPVRAYQQFEKSFRLFPNVYSLEFFLLITELFGQPKHLQEWMMFDDFSRQVTADWQMIYQKIAEGRKFTTDQHYSKALAVYDQILQEYPNFVDALFLKGCVLEKLGSLQASAATFELVIVLFPIHIRAILALGALHQRYGDYRECFDLYERTLSIFQLYHNAAVEHDPSLIIIHDDYLKVQGNLILAYFQQGNYLQAMNLSRRAIEELSNNLELLSIQENIQILPEVSVQSLDDFPSFFIKKVNRSHVIPSDSPTSKLLKLSLTTTLSNLMVIRRSATYWEDWEELAVKVFRLTYAQINLKTKQFGPLLPFDTLLLPFSLKERLIIAQATANSHSRVHHFADQMTSSKQHFPAPTQTTSSTLISMKKPLFLYEDLIPYLESAAPRFYCKEIRIGFISYDFNDHPTAQMMEGFFVLLHQLRDQERKSSSSRCLPFHQIRVIALSYGRNDGSYYHRVFRDNADEFYEITSSSYQEIELLLRSLHLQILFEMQVHTLGNRMTILSDFYYEHRFLFLPLILQYDHPTQIEERHYYPTDSELSEQERLIKLVSTSTTALSSPSIETIRSLITASRYNYNSMIVVNYLVYPGSSGSFLFDYLYCDKSVVVVETSMMSEYSEKLLLLPYTYQMSYYSPSLHSIFNVSKLVPKEEEFSMVEGVRRIIAYKQRLRHQYHLPIDDNTIIFCNFNKVDKIDPISFYVWMNIMHAIPQSYLWLLAPSLPFSPHTDATVSIDIVRAHIFQAAEAHGISRRRILFAPRVNKTAHIARHLAADLFLDTFIYSAHSTASDALRGGLPVLTLAGNSFPNRVGLSLYRSFSLFSSLNRTPRSFQEYLVADNLQQFEKMAMLLVRSFDEKCRDCDDQSGQRPQQHRLADWLKFHLLRGIAKEDGLFNTFSHIQWLRRSIFPMIESYHLTLSSALPLYHLVLTPA